MGEYNAIITGLMGNSKQIIELNKIAEQILLK